MTVILRPRSLPVLGLACLAALAPAAPRPDSSWPDTPRARLGALALLQTLNAELLGHDSATLTLDSWCARRHLAPPGSHVVADRVTGADKPAPPEVRAALQPGAGDAIRYRRVRLRCGTRILSEADNWYLPARLTPEMNALLDGSDTPFGRAVQALHFRRQTVSAKLLWSPLPDDWPDRHDRAGTGRRLAIPDRVIEHRAILRLPDGTPFSQVIETYQGAVLGAAPR